MGIRRVAAGDDAPRRRHSLDGRSGAPHNPLMEAEQATVAGILAPLSSRRALDVGTGSGRNLPLLASTGARLVCGVDFSMPMLAKDTSGCPRVCGNACALPFRDAGFDV